MNSPKNPADKPKRSVAKLVLFGFVTFALLISVAAAFILGPVWDYMFPPAWKKDFSRGVELSETDPDKGEVAIKKAIADAEAAKAPISLRMSLHRDYAHLLYNADEDKLGDDQISAAIAICPKDPPKNSLEADLLTHAYQDRGWDKYGRFLKNRKLDSGEQDMEQSVLVCENAFGPSHEQTIYKIPTLALIYDDTGKHQQADVLMKRAIDATSNVEGAKQCAWFVHSIDARISGLRKNYKRSVNEFLLAHSLAAPDKRKRVMDDLYEGLRQFDPSEALEARNVSKLLMQEKFAEIDMIADQMRKSKAKCSNGCWQLDKLYDNLEAGLSSEGDYTQHFFEYKKWLHENPKSVTARVACAMCYVDYGWFARGGGYSDGVSEQGWKLFAKRLEQAKATLDVDPLIKSKCPRAYYVYSKIGLGTSMPKDEFLKLVSDCHQAWPTFTVVDNSACWYLLPRWFGAEFETEHFINKRADQIGGALGDEHYAQMVWYIYPWLDGVFRNRSPLTWSRTQAGFHQIFKEFPRQLNPRIAYIKLAMLIHDEGSVRAAFDDWTNK